MSDLLGRAVAAPGGLDRFNSFHSVSADLVIAGALWSLKGRPRPDHVRVTVDVRREYASFSPWGLPGQVAVFTPQRLWVETAAGDIVEERVNPRAAFAGHARDTPWDDLHRLYFAGYAMWTYLTVPFCLAWPGCELAEIEPWQEQSERWRRLEVTFPPHIASHSARQTFYFADDGLLRRHDYDVEVAGNFPAAHYVSQYQSVSGLQVPTRRRVFPRRPDNTSSREPLTISIDLTGIRFA